MLQEAYQPQHTLRIESLRLLHDIAGYTLVEQARALETMLVHKAGFNPGQPRVPSGSSEGGQWTSGGGGAGGADEYPDAINSVYPIETAILGLASGVVGAFLRIATSVWNGLLSTGGKFDDIIISIEKFFGGKPDRAFFPHGKKDSFIMMKGNKKIRFDIKGHGHDSHFHIQIQLPNGKWVDAGSKHMYFFKK